MKVKELIKELKKFHADAEVDLVSCFNPDCPCMEGEDCDCKGCDWTAYDVMYVSSCKKNEDEKHDRASISIQAVDGWNYDENGELINDN